MKRYIKVKNRWIDTLTQQKAGYYYFVINKKVYCLMESNDEFVIGKLQDESDGAKTSDLKRENKKDEDLY